MSKRPDWFSAQYYMYNKLSQTQAIPGYETYTYSQLEADILAFASDPTAADALDEATWSHYEQYGSAEGLPLRNSVGNLVLDPQAYCESKLTQLLGMGYTGITSSSTWKDVLDIISKAGMSLYDHYMAYGMSEGLNLNSDFNAESFFEAKLTYIQAHTSQYPDLAGLTTVDAVAEFFTLNGVDAYQNWLDYGTAEGITAEMVKPSTGGGTVGDAFYLTPIGWTGSGSTLTYNYADNIKGTDGDDTFIAYVYGDATTLNTGDQVNGGKGTDTLLADIAGLSYTSALTPILTDVEILQFRVQEQGFQTGDNNVASRIDAERITGATQIWSSNSRDDLLVEDVRINSNQMTVGMQNTDPGDVDYEFYFDPQHLKADSMTTSGTLTLRLIDTTGALGGNPLQDNPYNVIYVHYNGSPLKIEFKQVTGAGDTDTMYAKLRDEIQTAVTAMGLGFTVTLGDPFSMVDSNTGTTVFGKDILVDGNGMFSVDKAAGDGWGSTGVMPPTTSVSATMLTAGSTDCPLIVTDIALDNVGRVQWDDATPACLPDNSIYGSRAGDMVVGSMAARGGVERFDVFVDRGSWLNGLSSTNNTLRMITVQAKDWDGDGVANSAAAPGEGQLFIGAYDDGSDTADDVSTWNANMYNWVDRVRLLTDGPGQDRAGIWDVKLFDGSGYAGAINIYAELTAEGYKKYLDDVDGLRTIYDKFAPSGEFKYAFGSGDDTLNMWVNDGIAADVDFKLIIDTGAGDDYVNFGFSTANGNYAVDQTALKNVTIKTGAGNDTVWTWGQNVYMYLNGQPGYVQDQVLHDYDGAAGYIKVEAGAGADAVYNAQDASISNAVWVLNANTSATSISDPLLIKYINGDAQSLNNHVASTYVNRTFDAALLATPTVVGNYTLYGVVNFLGIEVDFTIGTYSVATAGAAYSIKAEDLNKAIIQAINTDPVLGKLLLAEDGAGYSLLVESLIDGYYTTADDFSLSFYHVAAGSTAHVDLAFTGEVYVQQAHEAFYDAAGNYLGYSDATGADFHYYGLSEVYGGDGDDVLVTGYADALVYAGAGNDTIVVGNDTYNRIYGGTGADIIVLGQREDINQDPYAVNTSNGNNMGNAYDSLYQAIGDSSAPTLTGTTLINTTNLDVIHNFDIVTANGAADGGATLSDRLYITNYGTTTSMTDNTVSATPAVLTAAVTSANMATYDNQYMGVLGVYDAETDTFSLGGAGTDMLLAYDANSAANVVSWEAVVLTGVGAAGAAGAVFNDAATDYFTIA
ncbi:hypothetical protein LJC71_02015 [Desulfosarcina sp. OttesenSCG-928-A07]|nr:hypothetical protein [Desulfosarcina sp. OttesenSCG-928-A07]